MASEVDICNLALAHLGDSATVASINPPEGSAQASHCARFYPIARDSLLESHTWSFATTRVALAYNATNPTSTWKYCYALPADMVCTISILPPDAGDDYSVGVLMDSVGPYSAPTVGLGVYTPQDFVVDVNAAGNPILFTNVEDAVLRYVRFVTDTTKFSPLFVECLSHKLASMLAGPLIKGDVGRQVAVEQLKLSAALLSMAATSDANDRQVRPAQGAKWMVNR